MPQKDTTKYFLKSKVYVVSLIISVVSKTGFGIFLAHLVCFKSEHLEITGNFKMHVSRMPLILKSFEKVQIHHSRSSSFETNQMCLLAKKPHILWDLGFEKYFVVSF
jgi:hypothetical protein